MLARQPIDNRAVDGLFPYSRWYSDLPALTVQYAAGRPFPHVHLTRFFDEEVLRRVIQEIGTIEEGPWVQWRHYNENKSGLTTRAAFPLFAGAVIDELNSDRFTSWLTELTGIRGLLADPTLEGGGLHRTGEKGFLNVHADFTVHHHHANWRRRINVIVYLNPGWDPDWGGALELWDRSMQRAEVTVMPFANHAVVFNTDGQSYHGVPDPLRCPPGVFRDSLALYYYTAETALDGRRRSTDYRPRPADGWRKSAFIWADKKLVDLYSRVKGRLALSDDFASRALGALNRLTQGKR